MATNTSRKYWDFKLLSKNPHSETVDLCDNNIQYNQLFLTHATDAEIIEEICTVKRETCQKYQVTNDM